MFRGKPFGARFVLRVGATSARSTPWPCLVTSFAELFEPFCEEAPRPPEFFEILPSLSVEGIHPARRPPLRGTFSTSTKPRCSTQSRPAGGSTLSRVTRISTPSTIHQRARTRHRPPGPPDWPGPAPTGLHPPPPDPS